MPLCGYFFVRRTQSYLFLCFGVHPEVEGQVEGLSNKRALFLL